MSVKSNLLKQIEEKAQKIRDKRIEAASNKTIENYVFEFFRNIEDSRKLYNNNGYDYVLLGEAKRSLINKLKAFDEKIKVSIEYNSTESTTHNEAQTIRGVTLWWSPKYIKQHNCDPSLYMDVSNMLFF